MEEARYLLIKFLANLECGFGCIYNYLAEVSIY
jgi:hypothetical protein